jgi:hypothetical protein
MTLQPELALYGADHSRRQSGARSPAPGKDRRSDESPIVIVKLEPLVVGALAYTPVQLADEAAFEGTGAVTRHCAVERVPLAARLLLP